ncbi:hypothetical protein [uncultured Arcticibacterium sp.]|uniref:hypothetical protein n=1 Tax=uncultured Arcticibacterium sp. TaxID=2173042 RepID=UPI0030FA8BEE
MFPFKDGIAALVIRDGNEHNTIQYAPDGVNFKIAAISEFLPTAAGPYIPDAFTNTKNGQGITWGISHLTNVTTWENNHSILLKFDCDLSQKLDDPEMKRAHNYFKPEFYYKMGLSKKQKERIEKENNSLE